MYKISKEIYFYRVVEKLFLISKMAELVERDKTLCLNNSIIKPKDVFRITDS